MVKTKPVLGLYSTRDSAESTVDALRSAGFSSSDVSVLLPEDTRSTGEGRIAGEHSTKGPQGATAGAGSGAILGGALGWLAGIGALIIPGLGPFLAAGPLVTTLIGAGVGGAIGGFAGALVGLGIPEEEAKLYEARMRKGGILVAVHCDTEEQVQKAKAVMETWGAADITVSAEKPAGRTDKAA
jgi:hypothetical protein